MTVEQGDRNFDDLAHRFQRNVYDRLKGEIRLRVLQRDLQEWVPEVSFQVPQCASALNILDAGGGQSPLGLKLAQLGHRVTVCDISKEMLQMARQRAEEMRVGDRMTFLHQPIQSLKASGYDLVLCHAVLEWVVDPQSLLEHLVSLTEAGRYLSVSYYNADSITMKNLLRGNFKKVNQSDYTGYRGSLTPTWPRQPSDVNQWLSQLPLDQVCSSGMRCFHDYILDREIRQSQPETQVALELQLSQQEPWRSLARYIHVLSRKSLA